jgi:predicted ABC-class ATPase
MSTADNLKTLLNQIDGRGYKAYKQIAGRYRFEHFDLHIDHVQGDPFANPTRVRARVPQETAGIPDGLFTGKTRRIAMESFLARQVRFAIGHGTSGKRGTGKSGLIAIDAGQQQVLERTAVRLDPAFVEARLHVGLPAAGRTILGREAAEMLFVELPAIVGRALLWASIAAERAEAFVRTIENCEHIRSQLDSLGLVAFVAEGAVLPRESGVSDRPLAASDVVRFRPCDPFRVTIQLPNAADGSKGPRAEITGLGIPGGVTLIVGGGYHGKSTLLRALERGVYPHIPSDGREYVVTVPDAVKIRAEDGRRVEAVDISPYIDNLPHGRSTETFSTDDASGSTSQAANIMEAVETGTSLLLLDEDTSATNFMVRDARMQALVHKDSEPITPFLDRVRELYDSHGVSTVLVMGGCGDYFDVADQVIMMREYLPNDVTAEAKRIAAAKPTERRRETQAPLGGSRARIPVAKSFDASRGRRAVKIDVDSREAIRFGRSTIDLRHVEQLVDSSQTRAVGQAIHLASQQFMGGGQTLREIVEAVSLFFDESGLDPLDPFHEPGQHPGDFARPRTHEIAAAINRLRTVRMEQK